MYMNRQIRGDALTAVGMVDTPEAMADIHRPDMAAVIWHREPMAAFQTWINGLSADQLPSMRAILEPHVVQKAVTALCDAHALPDCANREMLIEDVAALSDIFAGVMQASYLRVRLDVVTGNACRRFHTDAVRARLICTYRGSGTQYGITTDGADPEQPFQVPAGSPMILRGTEWPESPKSGLVHRSPPIEGTGETRLMLVLDPIRDPAAEEEF